MILALIACAIVSGMAALTIAWAVLALFAMAALNRRYRPWQDWTIYFQQDKP